MKQVYVGGIACLCIALGSVFAQSSNDALKLEIFLNNHVQEYGDQRRDDVLKYFVFLMAKEQDNEKIQQVLGGLVQMYGSSQDSSPRPSGTPLDEGETSLWEYPGATTRLVTEGTFDEDAVEQAWIDRVNNEIRIPRGLDPVVAEWRLRETAREWSVSLRNKGVADHKRFSYSGYYDYADITKRFADRGVVFKNINRATSTENIGWARHTCKGDGCTDEVIQDIRRIYEYFASEESYNGVHRRTMIHPEFRVVGISFAIDSETNKVFAVMHYGTALLK